MKQEKTSGWSVSLWHDASHFAPPPHSFYTKTHTGKIRESFFFVTPLTLIKYCSPVCTSLSAWMVLFTKEDHLVPCAVLTSCTNNPKKTWQYNFINYLIECTVRRRPKGKKCKQLSTYLDKRSIYLLCLNAFVFQFFTD